MAKGLFHCQQLFGVGNLVRSLNVCRSLTQHYEIDFIHGGVDIGLTVDSPRFHKILLPPFTVDSAMRICDPYQKMSVQEIFSERKKVLDHLLLEPYDFIITSGFPFNKHEFTQEILHIINKVKAQNPDCLVICAQRDIASKFKDKRIGEMLEIFNQYYDYVFVQSDPTILRLEDSLSFAANIKDKTIYTGFVTQQDIGHGQVTRLKRIIVSMGGGIVGEDLMRSVARVTPFFPQYEFLFILGPYTNIAFVNELESFKLNTSSSNVHLSMFLANFTKELSQSVLSISLAGSTIIDACYTHTPAIVYPFTQEQMLRAQRFAEKGAVRMLLREQLEPEIVKHMISEALRTPYPDLSINCSGADNAVKALSPFIGGFS